MGDLGPSPHHQLVLSMSRNARRRYNLWTNDPFCYWCHKLTIYRVDVRDGRLAENDATVDHVESKYVRGSRSTKTVLACYQCNNERNVKEVVGLPLEERRRLGAFPPRYERRKAQYENSNLPRVFESRS